MPMIRAAAAAVAMVLLVGGAAGTATADPRDRGREHHFRHRRPPPPNWGYDQPSYVAVPPPLVYAPEAPPAAINFSLNFR